MGKRKNGWDTAGTADPNWLKGYSMNHNIRGYRKKGLGSLRGWGGQGELDFKVAVAQGCLGITLLAAGGS